VQLFGLDEAAAGGVEVEQLGIAAPTDRRLELAQSDLFGELLVEQVMEELFGDAVVALSFDGANDLAEEQDVLESRFAEELLLAENFGVGILGAIRRDGRIALVDGEEAEHLGGVDDGQKIVNLEAKVVGEAVDVIFAVVIEQQFEQAGDAAGTRVRQFLVVRGAGVGRLDGRAVRTL
jgi:hypothetical protein